MKQPISILLMLIFIQVLGAQDTSLCKLNLSYTLLDYPQNLEQNGYWPSMVQSMEMSNNLYDLSFWGVDAMANAIIRNRKNTSPNKIGNAALKYLMGFAFAKYGSELPIPLGVYTHEEFHRSVLSVNGYSALNGNWIFNRWDGTVYGLTDDELSALKSEKINELLYSYVSGVQSETYSTQINIVQDFYQPRVFYKNPLYLYNAYYVWDYFKFSISPESDSVKVIAPQHESSDPYYRDYAGNDLTAWVYDMFSPDSAYTNRDLFPDGEGVNRRIGFSDLTPEGQDFLKKQKNLSLLNFVNPAIFLVNRINVGSDFSFLLFMQYNPTHFGNDIALYVPFTSHGVNQLVALHNYNNQQKSFFGIQYGLKGITPFLNKKIALSTDVSLWMQPENQGYFDTAGRAGGNIEIQMDYALNKDFSLNLSAGYKTSGWMIGNPYLDDKVNLRFGIGYRIMP